MHKMQKTQFCEQIVQFAFQSTWDPDPNAN